MSQLALRQNAAGDGFVAVDELCGMSRYAFGYRLLGKPPLPCREGSRANGQTPPLAAGAQRGQRANPPPPERRKTTYLEK